MSYITPKCGPEGVKDAQGKTHDFDSGPYCNECNSTLSDSYALVVELHQMLASALKDEAALVIARRRINEFIAANPYEEAP
jgi:hypothetical protein